MFRAMVLKKAARVLAAALFVTAITGEARAEDSVYTGAECKFAKGQSDQQDRVLGKIQNDVAGSKTVICPIHYERSENTLDYVAVETVGIGSGAQCIIYRRGDTGSVFSNAAAQTENLGGDHYRQVFFPGNASFTMGVNQAVSVQCTLGSGNSILKYRVITK